MAAQLERQPGDQNSIAPAWCLNKKQKGQVLIQVLVTVMAMSSTCYQVLALLGERHIKVAMNGYVEG